MNIREKLLISSSVVFLIAYAVPILWVQAFSFVLLTCNVLLILTWILFTVDYVLRFVQAKNKMLFIKSNLFDVFLIVFPFARSLRILQVLLLVLRINQGAAKALRGKIVLYVAGAMSLILFCASLAVLDAERNTNDANISTFGDALWWAFTTVTTVGYGDHYPVTATGKIIAVFLMLSGIALLSVVTASFASWLIEKVQEVDARAQTSTQEEVRLLREEIQALKEVIINSKET